VINQIKWFAQRIMPGWPSKRKSAMTRFVVSENDTEPNYLRYSNETWPDIEFVTNQVELLDCRLLKLNNLFCKWDDYLSEYNSGVDFSFLVFMDLWEIINHSERANEETLRDQCLSWIKRAYLKNMPLDQFNFLDTVFLTVFADIPRDDFAEKWLCECLEDESTAWLALSGFDVEENSADFPEFIRNYYKNTCLRKGYCHSPFPESALGKYMFETR